MSAARLPRLQESLLVAEYVASLFGCEDLSRLREKVRDHREDISDDGVSHFAHALLGLENLKLAQEELIEFDHRIQGYVEKLNRFRFPPVELKYFQYLAALFAEIVLERHSKAPAALAGEIKKFATERWTAADLTVFGAIDRESLNKLAFWMATGSGKTLLMHLNYWQLEFHASALQPPDNVILITPNEALSRQHLDEFAKSGISAHRFEEAVSTTLFEEGPPVTVIEVTKLTETKKGGGVSVEVDAFGDRNLVFVDEGHRGASGEIWWELRRRLARHGFTFEYSATFGQIVNGAPAARRKDLISDYARSVLFDYSYGHFHADGYGKDYWVANLRESSTDLNHWMLLANLLVFLEQQVAFVEGGAEIASFNLERPLWVFVGHSVSGGTTRDDRTSLTDVHQVVEFLRSFVREPDVWIERVGAVLNGTTGLVDGSGLDMFSSLLPLLRGRGWRAEDAYREALSKVCRALPGAELRAVDLKAASGEIGLSFGDAGAYFGVINVGDDAGLLELFGEGGIQCEEDFFSPSLFESINDVTSRVNLLIGSRKFTEGWDSFRVSSMGLLNIGRGEGAQIIQLFGRGVRLWGKDRSLKRSTWAGGDSPEAVRLLETLGVFGIRANYMADFRTYLEEEGIEPDLMTVEIPIQVMADLDEKNLPLLRIDQSERFQDKQVVRLRAAPLPKMNLDLRPRIDSATPAGGVVADRVYGDDQSNALRSVVGILPWREIENDVVGFAQRKGYSNLIIDRGDLRAILESPDYEVIAPDGWLDVHRFSDLANSAEVAKALLRKFVSRYYEGMRRGWEHSRVEAVSLRSDDGNFSFGAYELRVPEQVVAELAELIAQGDAMYKQSREELPSIFFDRHLYQPLLTRDPSGRISAAPPALNDRERQFVDDLRAYLVAAPPLVKGFEVFLLRNLTRGHGVGVSLSGTTDVFYPDFLLWLLKDDAVWLTFVDPHGLIYAEGSFRDLRITLNEDLRALEPEVQRKSGRAISLASVILSTTRYANLKPSFGTGTHTRTEFEEHNVLFFEDADYIEKTLRCALHL